ncbi:hypothetical protein U14_00536 [Candidatus Moduliflexus flocculans]|uniref:DUF58 domain-containing protein n=1 Tax=Candidatus Moduliflexus flocculans TaxID=1499966 RepID=A0A0S6VVM1_9BACT|nr:hypothetical protein U14_00536 [Candidatus Moduliflexus flocculans]
MIVPRTRLLFWFALITLPLSLVGAMASSALLSLAGTLAFILLAIVDATLSFGALRGIRVELPDTIRFSKNREGAIEVTVTHSGAANRNMRVGLALPTAFQSPHEDLTTMLPHDQQQVRLIWPCLPQKRGQFRLETCYLETPSPLGLWAWRDSVPVSSELRVYPDLSRERNNLAALFLNRGSFGVHAQRQIGKGREFEKLREYMPGDSFEDIHWKATAKRGRPITKVFQIERTQEVYVLVDTSRLSARPARPLESAADQPEPTETILERFITAAMILGLAAQKQGDLFGVAAFGSQMHTFVRAKTGKMHYGACRDALYRLEPERGNPDFDELCSFLRLRLRRRALLIVLTNLDDPVLSENFIKNINLIHRQHLVLVNMLRPPAAHPLFSNSNVSSVGDLYRELGGHLLWRDLQELEYALQHRGVNFSLLSDEKMCVDLVSQYIGVKRRQLL